MRNEMATKQISVEKKQQLELKQPSEKLRKRLQKLVTLCVNFRKSLKEEYEETLQLAREEGFSDKQIAKFIKEESERQGIPARTMYRNLPEDLKGPPRGAAVTHKHKDIKGNDNAKMAQTGDQGESVTNAELLAMNVTNLDPAKSYEEILQEAKEKVGKDKWNMSDEEVVKQVIDKQQPKNLTVEDIQADSNIPQKLQQENEQLKQQEEIFTTKQKLNLNKVPIWAFQVFNKDKVMPLVLTVQPKTHEVNIELDYNELENLNNALLRKEEEEENKTKKKVTSKQKQQGNGKKVIK
jgi:hypothetical protein